MGYVTSYELEIKGPTNVVDGPCPTCNGTGSVSVEVGAAAIREGLRERNEDFSYFVESGGDEPFKWYDHEKDFIELSKEYPDYVFALRGKGESAGDVWVKYFKAGKVQESKAKIELEGFDEEKLR